MRRFVLTVMLLTVTLGIAGGVAAPVAAAGAGGGVLPAVIDLPDGFRPEGIAIGRGVSFYVGSLRDGAIYRGNLVTGEGAVLVPPATGGVAVGLEEDSRNRLFVAGGPTGTGRVYHATSGAVLAAYQFAGVSTFINDVVITRDAAYFTDSFNPVLYVVPLGPGGRLGAPGDVRTLDLTGDLEYQPGFNVNGIEASGDGRTLVVVQSNTGLLFAVDAASGVTTRVDLNGATVSFGDGLLRRGNTLYVVRNQLNLIDAFRVDQSFTTGVLLHTITAPGFDIPTTVAAFGSYLYAVNARFTTPPTPDTRYSVIQVDGR